MCSHHWKAEVHLVHLGLRICSENLTRLMQRKVTRKQGQNFNPTHGILHRIDKSREYSNAGRSHENFYCAKKQKISTLSIATETTYNDSCRLFYETIAFQKKQLMMY
ncbi:uncharacterized protein LOC108200474 isoform X5 [Daucus carota subsp. sativus]|uniref:uncharacterized protein LOC108200474 isoform X5 n=1 Tax=Daucus carota subsp. sativus TaxID=79200 RepID=UPI0030833584